MDGAIGLRRVTLPGSSGESPKATIATLFPAGPSVKFRRSPGLARPNYTCLRHVKMAHLFSDGP